MDLCFFPFICVYNNYNVNFLKWYKEIIFEPGLWHRNLDLARALEKIKNDQFFHYNQKKFKKKKHSSILT